MNTRMIATEYRMSHWAGIMRERKESGQSIRAYCKSAGICENVFYYWQRKLREAVCQGLVGEEEDKSRQSLVPKGWAAVQEPEKETGAGIPGAVRIEIGKCRVTVMADTDPELLAKVCRALVSIC